MSPLEITDRVRGTQTLGPRDLAARREILARLGEVAARFDFPAHEFPLVEHLDLYMAHLREEFRDRLFLLEDRSGRPLCLQPAVLTAAARLLDAQKGRHAQPLRLSYASPAFRYETIRRGNLRQFTLAGVEHLRPRDPLAAAAEAVAWAMEAARAVGLSGARLVVSDVAVLRATVEGMDLPRAVRAILLRHLTTPSAKIARYLPGAEEGEPEALPAQVRLSIERLTDDELVDLTLALAGSDPQAFPGRDAREVARRLVRKLRRGGDRGAYAAAIEGLAAVQGIAGPIGEALARVEDGATPAVRERASALRRFVGYLDAYGIDPGAVAADFGLIRPYAVYDGIVFELHHDAAGPLRAIGGGGQYDAGWVLGPPDRPAEPLPGCGFAFGIERVAMAAEAEGRVAGPPRGADCLVTTAGEVPFEDAMRLARTLRAAGLAVRLDLPPRSLKKELSDAASEGIPFVAICGEKERAQGRVAVRSMAARQDATLPAEEVAAWIAARREP